MNTRENPGKYSKSTSYDAAGYIKVVDWGSFSGCQKRFRASSGICVERRSDSCTFLLVLWFLWLA